MAPLTAWLPAHPHQDFDLVIKIMGPLSSKFMRDWSLIAQSFTMKGLSIITQSGRVCGAFSDPQLHIRITDRPVYSMGYGCDVFVQLSQTVADSWSLGLHLQPGSVLLYEPDPVRRWHVCLPEGVISYPVALKDLCLQDEEGLQGRALAALGVLLHLLGVPEESLLQLAPTLSAPKTFTAGVVFARSNIEKRDAYSLPFVRTETRPAIMLSSEQAILLGYAVSSCDCGSSCDAKLVASPVEWTADHLGLARSMVSVLESDEHPGLQAYRGPQGKVMALLRGNDSAIASWLKGFQSPAVFVAADIADVLSFLLAGEDLIQTGRSDGVEVLIQDDIAFQYQTIEVRFLIDMLRRHHRAIGRAERDGDADADVGFMAWGAAQGVVRDAVALCRSFGLRVAGLYPKRIVPFSNEDMESFAKSVGRVVVVESGQTQGYWDRLLPNLSFEFSVLTPEPSQSLTPMDIFLRERLGSA